MARGSRVCTEMSNKTPARAGMGRRLIMGASTKSMGRASRPENTEAMRVRAPSATMGALRVKEPQPGMPEVSPAAMLARPWPMSSWLPSNLSPLMPAICLPMARDCTAPSRAMARAGMNRSLNRLRLKAAGRERGGMMLGMAPARATPLLCTSRTMPARVARARAARMEGKCRESTRFRIRIRAMVSAVSPRLHGFTSPRCSMTSQSWGKKPEGCAPGRPRAVLSWLPAIRKARPELKATMTE